MSEALQQTDSSTLSSKGVFAYDIETLKSYFSAAFIDVDTEERFLFEVYEVTGYKVNNIKKLFDFLDKCKGLIGYNNLYFDYPVIHHLMENKSFVLKMSISELIEFIYVEAQRLIDRQSKFKYKVPDDKVKIPQLDLLEMNYFNSKARFVSLKQLEFVMRYPNVQDMPYNHRFIIKNRKQASEIGAYNYNDVDATLKFYHKCKKAIDLRKALSKQYGKNLINASETNLGKEAFAFVLTEEMKITRQELNKMGTKRAVIDVGKDVLIDSIKFRSEEFKKLHEFYKLQKITQLKGFFKDIKLDRPGYNLIKGICDKELIKKNGILPELSVIFKNHTYVYGSGGLHSKFKGTVVHEDENYYIWDLDVESFYPNLAINYGFKPEHLGIVFGKTYKNIFLERKLYAKGTPENQIKKIQLNASYGLSNNEYSFLYDPLMTAQICINGQLLLTMLAESLILDAECIMIAANTDGIAIKVPKKNVELCKQICKQWEEDTKLVLELNTYSSQYYRDINNYIWIPSNDGKVKVKGCFDDKPDYHKDHSMLIVQKALIAYYHKKIPVETTIGNCKDIYDFCKMVKAKGCKFTAEWYDNTARKFRKKQGKVVRYYITKSKGHYENVRLMKYLPPLSKQTYTEKWKDTSPNQMDIFDIPDVEDCVVRPDRIQHVEASNPVEIFNKFEDKPFEEYNVDLSYYINECNKIIKAIK